jgi:hypothetical protein
MDTRREEIGAGIWNTFHGRMLVAGRMEKRKKQRRAVKEVWRKYIWRKGSWRREEREVGGSGS